MSLDRRSIERRDFPRRLRGYDPAAVDAHLRELADALEARLATTADATAEQVRTVLAAAQESAGEIVAEAERTRTVAGRIGDEAATRVTATAAGALERIETLRGELTALIAALSQDGEPAAPPVRAEGLPGEHPPAPDLEPEPLVPDPEAPDAVPSPEDPDRLVPDPDAPAPDAEDGARLVALDLALAGTPREQAELVLAEHFELADPGALLDDVYAAAGR
jgi:DivIVA domain-containing protein